MSKIYLYLARRDKKGIRVLTTFSSHEQSCICTRLNNIKSLKLNTSLERELEEVIHANRMMWEPWVSCASSFEELKSILKNRGYSEIPSYCKCENPIQFDLIKKKSEKDQILDNIDTNHLPKGIKTMIRKVD